MTRTPSPQQQALINSRRQAQLGRQRAWHKRNKAAHNTASRQNHMKIRIEALQALGGLCACCGETAYEFLVVDHCNGGGTKERRELKESPRAFYKRLKIEGYVRGKYRVLCHNCNFSIGLHGYCPHENLRLSP